MTLPQEILDRVQRVLSHHVASKIDSNKPRAAPAAGPKPPPEFRIFDALPKVPLLTTLLDAPIPALSLLETGREAVPESQLSPPQNLKTLSTWLYMADGLIPVRRGKTVVGWEHTCPSSGGTSPCELYVAAFAIEGLDPGLYHYSPREFALRKMRDGYEALGLLKRGRPDLEFLKTTPGCILVSTVFARSAAKYQERGYRHALQDAGQKLENVSICGRALGMQIITRLRLNENSSRQLIGVPPDADFNQAESIQAMVVWSDAAAKPIPMGDRPPVEELAPIPRPDHAKSAMEYSSILTTHHDCVAPGMAVREVRPPLTELDPMPPNAVTIEMPLPAEGPLGQHVLHTLTTRRAAPDFQRRPLKRNALLSINHAAFRGGTHFPLFPNGPHLALIRPFWIIHAINGIDSGIWYYHPPTDQWVMLSPDERRMEAAYLAAEQPLAGNGAAVCFLMAEIHVLMNKAGPDAYRLAHLEAGMAAQRIYLGANSLGIGCAPLGDFYDDEVRRFLGLERTGWEPIHAVVIGISSDDPREPAPEEITELDETDLLEE